MRMNIRTLILTVVLFLTLVGSIHGQNETTAPTPAPVEETQAPETQEPNTPAPNTPAPNTPAPNTPAPNTPAPNTPAPNTPAPPQNPSPTPPPATPTTQAPSTPSEEPPAGTEDPAPAPNSPTPGSPPPSSPSTGNNSPSPNTPSMTPAAGSKETDGSGEYVSDQNASGKDSEGIQVWVIALIAGGIVALLFVIFMIMRCARNSDNDYDDSIPAYAIGAPVAQQPVKSAQAYIPPPRPTANTSQTSYSSSMAQNVPQKNNVSESYMSNSTPMNDLPTQNNAYNSAPAQAVASNVYAPPPLRDSEGSADFPPASHRDSDASYIQDSQASLQLSDSRQSEASSAWSESTLGSDARSSYASSFASYSSSIDSNAVEEGNARSEWLKALASGKIDAGMDSRQSALLKLKKGSNSWEDRGTAGSYARSTSFQNGTYTEIDRDSYEL